jgi:hypothetical protein
MLNNKQIEKNYERFRELIETEFPTRKTALNRLYDHYEDRILVAPASGTEHFHNAFPGGYVDHILRVIDFSVHEYENWKSLGLKVDNFTLEELKFAALNHDLGKIGLPGNYQQYKPNESEWHRKNQGKLFVHDNTHPFALVPDLSIFILQYFGVPMSWSEFIAIRTHDGVYDRANEAYYFSGQLDSRPRTNINQILHNADFKAARFEFERWATESKKFVFYAADKVPTTVPEPKPNDPMDMFAEIFGDTI